MEKWLPLVGYEGVYEISNKGKIKALKRIWFSGANKQIKKEKNSHIMKTHINIHGYESITLNKNGQRKELVHRLLALTFIQNPENKPYINHRDGCRNNNDLSNLEWCTNSENIQHAYNIGLQVSQKRGNHSQAKRVKCETLDMEFECINDAADILGLGSTNIGRVCNNISRQTKGLTFRFI